MLGAERVRVVEGGSANAFPILLLHGWGASAYNFRALFGPLAEAGFRVIAPDFRGHGWSETQLTRGAWTRQATTEWLRRLFDVLGVRECVLVGQSIGGAVALDAAAAMPDRVRGVVLLAPIGFTTVRRVLLARMFPWVRFPTTPRWIVASILRGIYGTRGHWTERDLDEYWIPLRRGAVVRGLLQSAREFDFTPRDPFPPGSCRIVVRFGELDRLIPHAVAMRHAARFEGVDVSVLRGVGHVPAEEIPEEIAELVLGVANDLRA
ncbi:MAG TPA: alpha/beta fold hydrolase [Gemmatimonadaceae bacterium]|nr:alpha/beta fold hydrolase [Gemmatimonadaceae bacterium]